MTESSSSRKSSGRRWRSSDEAYEAGKAIGFASALELVRILQEPEAFAAEIREMGATFSAAIKELTGRELDG